MRQPREHDELDARTICPELALAAVSPMTLHLAKRLTVYGLAFCHK
jgi:hypothetical protein